MEDDFERYTDHLMNTPASFFMYRDFQSRNVMIKDGQPYFIDYQGGRKGPLAYDIASLLFDAKANIPYDVREELLDHYIDCLNEKTRVNKKAFRRSFYDFVLMRILQALGTYGFRGGVEKKPLFLQSVPFALNNLAWLDEQGLLPECIPYLTGIIQKIAAKKAGEILPPPDDGLTIRVCSFSYKKGIPADNSGNGGGFVFDCRGLPNPGRENQFQALSGKDGEVIELLERNNNVRLFIDAAGTMVEPTISNYLERGFTSLAICFGCTGGQHRSVYCAEKLAKRLRQKFSSSVNVIVKHFEETNWQ